MKKITTLKISALFCIILFCLLAAFSQSPSWHPSFGLIYIAIIFAYLSIVYRLVKILHLTKPGLWVLGCTFMPYVFLTILMFKKQRAIEPQNITVSSDSLSTAPNQGSAFCEKCISETTDETPPTLRMINGIGTGWGYKNSDRCPKCNSVIKTKCFFIGFPLFPQERYRVIFLTDKIKLNVQEKVFFARKLKQE